MLKVKVVNHWACLILWASPPKPGKARYIHPPPITQPPASDSDGHNANGSSRTCKCTCPCDNGNATTSKTIAEGDSPSGAASRTPPPPPPTTAGGGGRPNATHQQDRSDVSGISSTVPSIEQKHRRVCQHAHRLLAMPHDTQVDYRRRDCCHSYCTCVAFLPLPSWRCCERSWAV